MPMPPLVLSPDTVIRFKGGRAVIHNPYSPEPALQTEDSAVVALVSRFATPQDSAEVLKSLPAQARGIAEGIVQQLTVGGVLVTPAAPARGADQEVPEVLKALRTLVESSHEIAEDALALGEAGLKEVAASGLGIPQRLFGLLAGADGLRERLAEARQKIVAGQLQLMSEKFGTRELKLLVGGGAARRLEGWVSIDRAPADLTPNVARGLPLDLGSARLIYSTHELQRLGHPDAALNFLRECRRVLRPGGRLRLVEFRAVFGGEEILEGWLKAAGFSAVERSQFMASAEPDLRIDQPGTGGAEEPQLIRLEASA